MAIAERDYLRDRTASAGDTSRLGPVTLWLILINVAVFVLDPILFQAGIKYIMQSGPRGIELAMPLNGLGHFSLLRGIRELELWRVITFQFLHAGFVHLLFNMFGLYFFGPMIEAYLGSRRYLAFYLLCGIGGAVAYLILWKARILVVNPAAPLVGASAGLFGILIAATRIAPETTVLVFFVLPVKLRTLAWALLGIALYTVLAYGSTGRNNAGGEAAHVGGALAGFVLIRNPDWLNFLNFEFLHRRRPPPF